MDLQRQLNEETGLYAKPAVCTHLLYAWPYVPDTSRMPPFLGIYAHLFHSRILFLKLCSSAEPSMWTSYHNWLLFSFQQLQNCQAKELGSCILPILCRSQEIKHNHPAELRIFLAQGEKKVCSKSAWSIMMRRLVMNETNFFSLFKKVMPENYKWKMPRCQRIISGNCKLSFTGTWTKVEIPNWRTVEQRWM